MRLAVCGPNEADAALDGVALSHNSSASMRKLRPHGSFALKTGATARILAGCKEYPLPNGLNVGDKVTVLGFDTGYYTVETENGNTFKIFSTSLPHRRTVRIERKVIYGSKQRK